MIVPRDQFCEPRKYASSISQSRGVRAQCGPHIELDSLAMTRFEKGDRITQGQSPRVRHQELQESVLKQLTEKLDHSQIVQDLNLRVKVEQSTQALSHKVTLTRRPPPRSTYLFSP